MGSQPLAAIYTRLSYADDGTLERIERQEADCRALAARLDWTVSDQHVFTDPARSAWQRNRKRPGWDDLLRALESGEIGAVLVYHGDRLIRQPYDLERLIGIADSKGVRIASPSGTRNLDSADDRFILRIEAAQACRESDNTSRRVKRAIRDRKAAGRPVGAGKRPFGFAADRITHVPEEAKQLAAVVDRLLSGQSKLGAMRWLNTVSTTTEGNAWQMVALTNLLRSPRIAGLVRHEGELITAVWDPIVDVETWADLQALLNRLVAEHPPGGQERKYLLSGVATCPSGHGLSTKPTGGRNRPGSRIYWCRPPCPTQVGRSVELLDGYVEGRVVGVLQHPRFVASVNAPEPGVAPEIAALERRRDETRAQLEALADDEALDPVLLARALAGFEKKITALRARQVVSDRRRLLRRVAGISAQEWAELPVDVRSDTVRALFRVTVLPTTKRGPGFDPGAVDLRRLPLE